MPALMCLVTFVTGLIKQDVSFLAVSSAFAIAYAIERNARGRNIEED